MKLHRVYCLLFCWPIAALAQPLPHHAFVPPTSVLPLDWVLSEVASNNPSLKGAGADWRAMRERVAQQRAWDDPRLGIDAKAARFVDVPANSFADQTVSLEQTIPVAGRNKLRAHAATFDANAAHESLQQRRIDLEALARDSYYRLVNAYGQWEINRRASGFLAQIVDAARHKLESGQETQAGVLAAETDLAKLDESAFDFERQVADEETALNTLMNHPADAPLGRPQAPAFSEINVVMDRALAAALAHRPELLGAKEKISAARARLETSRRNWIPEPTLRVAADRYNASSEAVDDVMAGVSFNLPWFERGKYAAGIRENRELVSRAQFDLATLQTQTAQMIRGQLTKIETFRHHYELFRDKVAPLARQSIEASRVSYESGQAALTQVLAAQQSAQDSESMLLQHLTDYEIALADLSAIAGAPISDLTVQIVNNKANP